MIKRGLKRGNYENIDRQPSKVTERINMSCSWVGGTIPVESISFPIKLASPLPGRRIPLQGVLQTAEKRQTSNRLRTSDSDTQKTNKQQGKYLRGI